MKGKDIKPGELYRTQAGFLYFILSVEPTKSGTHFIYFMEADGETYWVGCVAASDWTKLS